MHKKKEIVKVDFKLQPLNQALYKDLSIEELEKRLEFSIWCDCNGAYCPQLQTCEVYPAS